MPSLKGANRSVRSPWTLSSLVLLAVLAGSVGWMLLRSVGGMSSVGGVVEARQLDGSRCVAMRRCTLTIRADVGGAGIDALVHASIGGPRTLVAPISVTMEPLSSRTDATTVCVVFVPAESGAHRVALRAEYTSAAAATRGFAEATVESAAPSFLGTPLRPASFELFVAPPPPGAAAPPLLPRCASVADATRDGFWRRSSGAEGDLTSSWWQCPEFYLPTRLQRAAAACCGLVLSAREAHAAHNAGVPMWRPREHVAQVAALPAVRARWAAAAAAVGRTPRALEGVVFEAMHRAARAETAAARAAGGAWRWVPRACRLPERRRGEGALPRSAAEAAARLRGGGLVTLADSVGRFAFNYARCALTRPSSPRGSASGDFGAGGFGDAEDDDAAARGSGGALFEGPFTDARRSLDSGGATRETARFVQVRGLLAPDATSWRDAARNATAAARAMAAAAAAEGSVLSQKNRRITLVVNSGLWDVTYSELGAYAAALPQLLRELRRGSDGAALVWASTSAVHPLHFMVGDSERRSAHVPRSVREKRSMTEPRVERANAIARRALGRGRGATAVPLLDLWQLTRSRENDPLTPTDMRHYGAATVREMAWYVALAALWDEEN